MGLLDEAITYGKRAKELIDSLYPDRDFVRFTLAGLGMSYFFRGECPKAREIGAHLLRYGQQHSDIRCMTQGYNVIGWSHYAAGNYELAIQNFQNAIQVSADIVFEITARLFLGISYILSKKFNEAEGVFNEITRQNEDSKAKFIGNFAQFFSGVFNISQGRLKKGLTMAENVSGSFLKSDSMYRYASANHVLGRVYVSLAVGDKKKSLSLVVKNIIFLMKNIPFASNKAEAYFNKAIKVANKIGAKGILGQAYLDLGLLYKAKKRNDKAQEFILKAVNIFDECKAEGFQKLAREALSAS
jgi:tetratricopeptide (TPR) repeat protein